MRKRTHHVSVRLNDKEYGELIRQAESAGMFLSPYIRLLLNQAAAPSPKTGRYDELLKNLSRIGGQINEIAHTANARKQIRDEDIVTAAALMEKVWRLVKDAV